MELRPNHHHVFSEPEVFSPLLRPPIRPSVEKMTPVPTVTSCLYMGDCVHHPIDPRPRVMTFKGPKPETPTTNSYTDTSWESELSFLQQKTPAPQCQGRGALATTHRHLLRCHSWRSNLFFSLGRDVALAGQGAGKPGHYPPLVAHS